MAELANQKANGITTAEKAFHLAFGQEAVIEDLAKATGKLCKDSYRDLLEHVVMLREFKRKVEAATKADRDTESEKLIDYLKLIQRENANLSRELHEAKYGKFNPN